MNILGWYRVLKSNLNLAASQGAASAVMEPTELQRREPMVVHVGADMTHALMPWQVLTQLTAFHLHHSPALMLGGLETDGIGGAPAGHLDPVHFMGGIGAPRHINSLQQHFVSSRSPQGLLGV